MARTLKWNYLLLIIIILAAFLRFFWLDRIPSAMGGDELVYILETKSIAVSGRDLTGTWNPLTIFRFNYPPGEMQAELPYIINLPVVGLTRFSLFTARATSAFLSVFTVVGLYLLARELFNSPVAIAIGFITAINPWEMYIGRTAYDMVPSVCFYVWGMYVMVTRKGKLFLWSLPLYILAFYSYIGTKVIFLPILFIVGLYLVKKFPHQINKKHILIFSVTSILLVCFYLFCVFSAKNSTRITELVHISDPVISQTVDTIRKSSIRSTFVDIYVNKYTVFSTIILTKLLKCVSFDYLFVNGDNFFSLYSHGLFYYTDAVFLILGVLTMFAKNKRVTAFIGILALVGIIPHLLHSVSTENFSPHIVMMIPFFLIFIGYGIHEFIYSMFPKYKRILLIVVVGVYVISLGNFLQIYWFQNSLTGKFDFPLRVMSKYIQIQNKNHPIIVYSLRPVDVFKKYLFYGNLITDRSLSEIQRSFQTNNIQVGNVSFIRCDAKAVIPKDATVLNDAECGALAVNAAHLKITRLTDGGETFSIYNDGICSGYRLKPYPSNISIKDLDIERMNKTDFCETYITR